MERRIYRSDVDTAFRNMMAYWDEEDAHKADDCQDAVVAACKCLSIHAYGNEDKWLIFKEIITSASMIEETSTDSVCDALMVLGFQVESKDD